MVFWEMPAIWHTSRKRMTWFSGGRGSIVLMYYRYETDL